MQVFVQETETVYQYSIPNYETLWDAVAAQTGVSGFSIDTNSTTVQARTQAQRDFINAWTGSTIEGVSGVTRNDARWKIFYGTDVQITGGTYFSGTSELDLYNNTGGTITISGFTAPITGGTYNNGNQTLSLNSADGSSVDITGFTAGGGTITVGDGTNSLKTLANSTYTATGTGAATLSGTTLNIPTASSGSTHYIGESYGGGIVFYIWDGGAHGLIGANTELNGGQAMTWGGGSSSYVGTTSYYGVLGGKMNTQRILNVIPVPTYGNGDPQTGQRSAAFYAATYLNSAVVVSGVTTTPQFSDWYLPNAYELTLFATQSSYFPNCNFATHDHWSSSERSDYAYLAYALGANSNTYIYQAAKTSTYYVVAIRSF
jgi:hypothetical protein